MLVLDKPQVPQFVLLCPGFKALSMSIAQKFIIRAAAVTNPDLPLFLSRAQGERPLKYAVAWVRIVAKMMGPMSSWRAAAAAKKVQLQQKATNSLQWVHEVMHEQRIAVEEGTLPVCDTDDLGGATTSNHLKGLARYQETGWGDSRTLANAAAKKHWRSRWSAEQQIRTELLRIASTLPGGIAANPAERLAASWPKT